MQELTVQETSAFRAFVENMAAELGHVVSDNTGCAVTLDSPQMSSVGLDALMGSGPDVVQTVFSYPDICPDELLFVLGKREGALFSSAGAAADADLTDEQLGRLSQIMQSIAEGLGDAIGATLGAALQTGPCRTSTGPASLPPSCAVTGKALKAVFAMHFAGGDTGELAWFATQDFARAIAACALPAPTPAEQPYLRTVDGGMGGVGGVFPDAVAAAENLPQGLDLIMDVPLDLTVELGRVRMLIKDVLELSAGSIVELDRAAGEPVDLLVNGRLVAKGEVVVIEDNFGIRITEIISPADRLGSAVRRA